MGEGMGYVGDGVNDVGGAFVMAASAVRDVVHLRGPGGCDESEETEEGALRTRGEEQRQPSCAERESSSNEHTTQSGDGELRWRWRVEMES